MNKVSETRSGIKLKRLKINIAYIQFLTNLSIMFKLIVGVSQFV